ncbi:MAG: hypothetical protein SNJ74_00580 [Fimbriimonadaceae bacterium]
MRQAPRMGAVHFLRHPAVQTELRLTERQKLQIEELLPGPPGQDPGIGRPGARRGGPGMGPGGGPGPFDIDGALREILGEAQYRRWTQIELQLSGPQAFARPEIGDQLQLTDRQRQQIIQILRDNRPDFAPGGPGAGQGPGGRGPVGPGGRGQGPGGPGVGRGQGQAGPGGGMGGPTMGPNFDPQRRERVMQQIMGVLNPQQQRQYRQMLGAPFQLPPPNGI